MSDDDHPRIVRVELPPTSLRTRRELEGNSSSTYPILLYLSRQLDEFERNALAVFQSFVPGEHDPATVLLLDHNLEALKQNLAALNGQILNITAQGRLTRDAAYAEDDRLHALEAEINEELERPDN